MNFDVELPQFSIILQKLQVLRAQAFNNSGRLAALIDQLVLPSLIELQLRGGFRREDVLFLKVKNLVARSGCSLHKLELDDGDMDVTPFTQLLSQLPTLEHLDIARPPDAILTALIPDPSSPDPILPKLSSLTIEISANNAIPWWELEGQPGYTCDVQILRAVLNSRMRAIVPPPGSFHDATTSKHFLNSSAGAGITMSISPNVWDFQAMLEGSSTVPGFPEERLRKWQVWFSQDFSSYASGKDLVKPKLLLAMRQSFREESGIPCHSTQHELGAV